MLTKDANDKACILDERGAFELFAARSYKAAIRAISRRPVSVTCSALDSWLVFNQRDCLNNCNKPAPNAPPKCGCCSLQS